MTIASTVNLDRAKSIRGWMDDEELTWLAEQATQATKIVEVGSWCGRSTRALADHTTGTVWCTDPWNGQQGLHVKQSTTGDILLLRKPMYQDVFAAFLRNLSDHLATNRVQVLPVRSLVAIRILQHLAPFDLVFLDGDHAYSSIVPEIEQFRPLVRPGGILAGHDYGDVWPDVKRAVDEFVPDRQLVSRIWWTRV